MHKPGIFISLAEKEGRREFSKRVFDNLKASGYDDIYYYPEDNITNTLDWDDSLERADYLLCILDDVFFCSQYCYRELLYFFNKESKIKGIRALVSPNSKLILAASQTNERIIEYVSNCCRDNDGFSESDILKFSDMAIYLLRELRYHNFSDVEQFEDRMNALKDDIPSPRLAALVDYAALSALCLGADRFKLGGWGYSLGRAGQFDVDNDELPNGPLGMTVIGLRALKKFLPPEEVHREFMHRYEQGDLYDDADVERNPLLEVRDNLPVISHLLCAIEVGRNQEFQTVAESANKALQPVDGYQRWRISPQGGDSREYSATGFALARALSDLNKENRSLITRYLSKKQQEDGLQNCLFEPNLRTRFRTSAHSMFQQHGKLKIHNLCSAEEYRDQLDLWISWLLASPSEPAKDSDEIFDRVFPNFDDDEYVKKLYSLRNDNEIRSGKYADHLIDELVKASIIAKIKSPTDSLHASMIRYLLDNIFTKVAPERSVPNLNAVGWISIIELAFAEIQADRDAVSWGIQEPAFKSLLRECWKLGLELRAKLPNFVLGLSKDGVDFDPAMLAEQVRIQHDESLAQLWSTWSELNAKRLRARETTGDQFRESIKSASFWVSRSQERQENDGHVSTLGALCGTLRVCADTSRVDVDSPGYGRLFLDPFSEYAGMSIADLSCIRREFGDDDAELVKIMGNIVVDKLYVIEGGSLVESEFELRTKCISERLASGDWPLEIGEEDFLRLRVAPDDGARFRWVHRTAIIQERRQGRSRRLISWRFKEVPAAFVEALSARIAP